MESSQSIDNIRQQLPEKGGDQIQVGNIQGSKAIAIGQGATAVYQGLSVEEVAALVVELRRVDQPTVWDGRIPYLGLTAFRESDAQFFFGREGLVDDLLERVQQSNFIVIAGPSGSGKSSVARAGLFHALRDGRLPRSDTWLLATMKPRGNPIEQLAEAIGRLAKSPTATDYIKQEALTNPLSLQRQLETLLSDDPRQRAVLLVDQFEETFTQTKDEAVRTIFINLLTAAAQAKESRTIVVLSLRSDFVSQCARYPELRTLINQQFQLVGAMEPQDLAKAITLPTLEVGAEIDPALVSRIMADMKGEPGTLPLMSFALRDLFEAEKTQKGKPMDMTLLEYLHRGGLESALERHANKVFGTFSDEQKVLAKNIFSKLIEVGQGRVDSRRTANFAELVPEGVSDEAVADVVSSLAEEGVRLLTTSGVESEVEVTGGMAASATVTIAHEKLIDAWPWLRQLVDENRDAIRVQNEIAEAAKEWENLNRDPGLLYRGAKLQQAIEWYEKSEIHIIGLSARFLGRSRQEVEREAREKETQHQRELQMAQELAASQTQAAQRWRWAVWAMTGVAGALLIIIGILLTPFIQERWARSVAKGEMAFVPAGTYLFGKSDPASFRTGSFEMLTWPQQELSLAEFWMDKYEVTNYQYGLCVRYSDRCTPPVENADRLTDPEKQNYPVVNVTLLQANAYCQWLGKRLPTEVEWEQAARGLKNNWPWGDSDPTPQQVNMPLGEDANPDGDAEPVTSRESGASAEGIYHLVGNVWEWTTSYWQPEKEMLDLDDFWDGQLETYQADKVFVVRGGGWNYGISHIAGAFPLGGAEQDDETGIRCVVEIVP